MSRSGSSRVSQAISGAVEWSDGRRVVRDLFAVAGWVAVVTLGFRIGGWPTWLYYVVVFGGVIGYSLVWDGLPVDRLLRWRS